jgi:hypothetical protein
MASSLLSTNKNSFSGGVPGYGSSPSSSSWGSSNIDWGKGNGIDWGKGNPPFGVADEDDPILGSKKSGYTGKYQNLFEKSNPWEGREARAEAKWGSPTGGSAGQVLENLGVVFPQQHAPMFIPGQEGKKGVGGALGTLAGIGLSFIPGIGPGLAAALPAIGGATGSMFG